LNRKAPVRTVPVASAVPAETGITGRQRWATNLAILAAALAMLGGFLLRQNIEDATRLFLDRQTGISARYPAGWLLERGSLGGPFVMRVQDPAAVPFKTSLSIAILPIGLDAAINDITQILTINRSGTLAAYQTLGINAVTLPDGTAGTQINYAYATGENNPALRSLPVIVRAVDVIVVRRGQATVITFLSDATSFESNRRFFDAFLRRLEIQ
jgi:hypothetical protein